MSLSSSSPPAFSPSPAHPGLIIPPFPKREGRKDGAICASKNDMDDKNVNNVKNRIFEQLEDFDGYVGSVILALSLDGLTQISNPPFTIQRLCEICIEPRKHYKAVGKYLRALERTILVTSTKDMYLDEVGDEDVEMGMAVWGNESLRTAMTPVFSPIPFLHDDARRSRSPSPFELAATKRPIGPHDDALERPSANSLAGRQGIGLVDELDDPKPGHLADHPTALTTATSAAPPPSLSERFVKSSSPEPELGEFTRDASETVDARQAEDAEVEGMVLNDNVQEDEDKENRPS